MKILSEPVLLPTSPPMSVADESEAGSYAWHEDEEASHPPSPTHRLCLYAEQDAPSSPPLTTGPNVRSFKLQGL